MEATVSQTLRETVEAVRELYDETSSTVSVGQLSKHLKLDKAAVSRRVRACLNRGYLRNLETGRGKAYKLEIGDDLPEGQQILPLPADLAVGHKESQGEVVEEEEKECCAVVEQTEGMGNRRTEGVDKLKDCVEIPPDEPVPGAGVYRFDTATGRAYKKASFG